MNRIICNRIELVHQSQIARMSDTTIELKANMSFTLLNLESKATYSSQTQKETAGILKTETVTAKIRYDQNNILLSTNLQNFIIRLYTDNETFIVGSLDYPAKLTYTSDKIYVNLTFKATSPA